VHKETRTYTGNRLNPVLMHVLASEQESHRPLLTPDEALRLPPDAALVFVSGSRPILGRKLQYFRDPKFAKRARIPAPAISDRLPHQSCTWAATDQLAISALPPTEAHDDTAQAPPDHAHTDARLPDTEALFGDNAPADER
jgi:type IV secretory pathway TraG/TraD family ATPase VirD4